MRHRRDLRDVLFQLSSADDQLLLAVVLCLIDPQTSLRGADESVRGVIATELWEWLDERTGTSAGHPNIDHVWKSQRAVQGALRRLEDRGLVQAATDYYSRLRIWQPTSEGRDYLRQRRLFADDEPDRLAG